MNGPERRLTPRKAVERFAYINIEPGNGGSVLNVSEQGLCFHSIAPVQRSETIRFWFREHDRRIEVPGAVIWMDKKQKTVGLRFIDLPDEAREPMRRWVTLPTPIPSDHVFPMSTLLRQGAPAPANNRLDTTLPSDSFEPPAMVARSAKAPFTSFSGGLATGLLVSALLAAPFLLRSYKRQFGESLIYWGERFAARSHSPMQRTTPAPQAGVPPAEAAVLEPKAESTAPQQMAAAERVALPAPKSIPILESEKLLPEPIKKTADTQPAHRSLETPPRVTSTPPADFAPKAPAAVPAAAISTTVSRTASPTASVAAASNVLPANPSSLTPLEPASRNHILNATAVNPNSSSQVYLEVGKFKDSSSAYRVTDNLTRLGFRARVMEKNHFWANSYHVLAGPYDDDNVDGIRKKLVASGFKPQVFERGSRNLAIYGGCETMNRLLRSARTLRDVNVQVEDCVISWETYSTHAVVTFAQENSVVATGDGKWVNHGITYQHDAFVYRKNDDGSQTLIEIQFAGMSHALVFEKS
jgi:hypothetical protein